MEKRRLGRSGPEVGAVGLGCMGMSDFYGPRDEAESIATIHRALELGVTLLDTADVYGPHTNEELVGSAIRGRRGGGGLAAKFGSGGSRGRWAPWGSWGGRERCAGSGFPRRAPRPSAAPMPSTRSPPSRASIPSGPATTSRGRPRPPPGPGAG